MAADLHRTPRRGLLIAAGQESQARFEPGIGGRVLAGRKVVCAGLYGIAAQSVRISAIVGKRQSVPGFIAKCLNDSPF